MEPMQDFQVDINEAIGKATPKKPVNFKFCNPYLESATCPTCKYDFPDIGGINESYGEVEQYDYCPKCRQRIDWSCIDAEIEALNGKNT